MNQLPELDLIIQALAGVKKAAIFLPANPSLDKTAAALSLSLSFEKAEKSLDVVCFSPMTVGFSRLVGVDKISEKIAGRNLVISLDYVENAIDKVSYNIENKKFNLVIQPKPGFPALSSENVKFTLAGDLELIVIIGAQSLSKLGAIYQKEEKIFQKSKILNIDIGSNNSRFGKINAIFSNASSYSELIAGLLEKASYPVNQDIANNLLVGIQKATENFSSNQTGSEAFAAAAFCLRNGAKRQPSLQARPASGRKLKPSFLKTMTKGDSAARMPQEPPPEEKGKAVFKNSKNNQKDWYGPKIYRGSKLI
jgi:nanoRNase/pAp phosphatase (c-di-AMP/oligoRNAs hydrolase)